MRKVIIAFIVGFALAIGFSSVYADVVSMIGKQVDGQVPLKINGTTSENPAVTIEGVSYVPLRAAGEIFGYNVSWIDGEVIMQVRQTLTNGKFDPTKDRYPADQEEKTRVEKEVADHNRKLEIKSNLILLNGKKTSLEEQITHIEENRPDMSFEDKHSVPYEGSKQQAADNARIESKKQELAPVLAEITALEKELAELEAQSSTK